MKKLVICFICMVIAMATCFTCCGATAFAEEPPQAGKEAGYDLAGDYLVNVEFRNYNKSYGGVERSIVVTFDKDYQNSAENVLSQVAGLDAMSTISAFFMLLEFETKVDDAGRIYAVIDDFDSYTDLYIAQGIDGYESDSGDDDTYTEKKSFFYVEGTNTDTTIFADVPEKVTSLQAIGNAATSYDISTFSDILAYVVYYLESSEISEDRISLTYSYGTPYKKAITSSGTVTYSSDYDINVHSFYMNMTSADTKMQITQKNPNAIGWYSVAIAGALAVVLIPTLIAISKRNKNKE